jgi:chromate transporter
VSIEDYLEYFTLARILPGSTGQSVAVLTAQRLRGSAGALACLVPYVLPGGLLALFLAALIFGVERPAWLEGALHGFSIGGLAFVLATTFRTARAVRLSRAGLLVVAATSLAYGPLGLSLVPVLLGFGVLSLILHRPRPTGAASGAGVAVPAGAGGETEKSHA